MMHLINFKTYTPHPALQHLIRKLIVKNSLKNKNFNNR
jgi:hypothetical protein